MSADPNALAREEGLRVAEKLLAIADEVGGPGSMAAAAAMAHEALKHIETALGSHAAMVAAWMLAGEFRKGIADPAFREEGAPVPFALVQVEARGDGFAIVCRSAVGLNEHAFADAQSTAETAIMLPLLGWRLRFGVGTDAVRDLVVLAGKVRS